VSVSFKRLSNLNPTADPTKTKRFDIKVNWA
jgi:hypothetical protein